MTATHTVHAAMWTNIGTVEPVVACYVDSTESERDCRIEDSDECGMKQWADALGWGGFIIESRNRRVEFPVTGTVRWDITGHPLLVVES